MELTRGLSIIKEDLVNFSDFLELRGAVGRLQAETNSLRARNDISPTLSSGPAEGSRASVSVLSGDSSTLFSF